jgi:dodecin
MAHGKCARKEIKMNLVKVIEVLAESDKSWEDATQQALMKASQSIHHIKSIYIKEFQAVVDDNNKIRYRINAKISFLYDQEKG